MVIMQRNGVSLFIEVSCSGNVALAPQPWGVSDAGGISPKPQFPAGLLHWSRAQAEPCGFGKGDSRGTAELEMFQGMSEPLPKPVLVLDSKSPSCCPGHSPSRCSVPRVGTELAVKPPARLLWAFPPGAG